MQQVIIDLRTGQVSYVELTAQEEADHVQQGNARKLEEKVRGKKEAKQAVGKLMAELREMKQNRQIFSQQDLDEKQVEIDGLVIVINEE